MKTNLKRLTSIFLCLAMVISLFPVTAFAATSTGLSSTVKDATLGNGIELTKKVEYDPATGKVTTEIEAYTTGTVTSSVVTKPTDILFVLDTSGSMAWSFSGSDNGSNERLNSLKNAVNTFIDKTKELNEGATDKHSIAIVQFASSANTVADFTTVDDAGATSLKSKIDALSANGATAVDYGLEHAYELLSARVAADGGAYEDREQIVIVFTDGDPTHSQNYEDEVAHDAVNEALLIKDMGAKIYTIGIFNGADPDGTDDSNKFMNYTSSNYPKAYGSEETEIFIFFPVTTYELNPGATPHNTGYYLTADNASSLTNVFEAISSHIGKPDISLGSTATLVDVISDYFTIEGIGTSNPTISTKVAAYKGGGLWDTPVADANVTTTLTGTDTITVKGFDFDNNYISETARDGSFYGKKLILTFVTDPNYSAIDGANFATAEIPTNDTAAILDSTGTAVEFVPSPKLTANTVTYKTDTNGVVKTVASYYRFPGYTVTLNAKPADTDVYTYSDWVATGVTVYPGSTNFVMPEGDVVLTSTATTNQYNVTYEYRGTVPAGTLPATAPTPSVNAVGSTVTHPTITNVPEGYEFSGWVEDDGDVATGVASFTMPAYDLHFIGTFIAKANSYIVEHYMMDTDGNYPSTPDHKNVYDNVKTGDSVKASIPAHTGFKYDLAETTAKNALMSTDATPVPMGSVLANGALVLKVYYSRNQYEVEYKYDGTVPGDATALPSTEMHYYGETVDVADDATASGYDFSGWRVFTGDTVIDDNGKMVMPDHKVVIHGSFTARGDTKYTIEHYFENIENDDFTLSKTTTRYGLTGSTAHAEPLSNAEIIGFTFDEGNANNVIEGVIDAANPLVLKLYYVRTRHSVTYEYTGTVPATPDPTEAELLAAPYGVTNVKFGATVKIGDIGSAEGYTFDGWNIVGSDIVVSESGGVRTFTMPARDVHLTGHFNPIPSKYTVEHWVENESGGYDKAASIEYTAGVYATQVVKGIPNNYNVYIYDVDVTKDNNASGITVDATGVTGTVTADGALVLKLYYVRTAYSITYSFETNPASVPVPTPHLDVKHGTVVDLADITDPAGYTFDGWYYGDNDIGDSLTMPERNVELVGKFIARNDVEYKVKYYLQNLDGTTYTEQTADGYTEKGTTGAYVAAKSKDYHGFSFDATQGAWNGHIKADGSLVLELYYNRNTFTVYYNYFGEPPTDTTITFDGTEKTLSAPDNLLVMKQENVMYGTPLNVEPELIASDSKYEFVGWYTANIPGVSATTQLDSSYAYTMPNHDVEFRGVLYNYKVYYDLNGGTLEGTDTVAPKSVHWNEDGLLPVGTPMKSGKVFLGWRYENKADYVTNSDKYGELAGKLYVENIILVAEYEDVYTVEYDWGTEYPSTETLPNKTENIEYGTEYTVDTVYTAGKEVDEYDAAGNL
ncbi:MAG: VWA domain-containing protein, partial [Ruminococcaceae bacterium]|nr:VWA domain-containing protein [Oscillospiraceae bacterium]